MSVGRVFGAFEVLGLVDRFELAAFESDERLLSYPVIVGVSQTDSTVLIDKVKERRVRPSLLVRTLRTLQDRPPRFKAGAFLEALAAAYDLTVAQAGGRAGATAKLVDVVRSADADARRCSRLHPLHRA